MFMKTQDISKPPIAAEPYIPFSVVAIEPVFIRLKISYKK